MHPSNSHARPGHVPAGVAPRSSRKPATARVAAVFLTCAGLGVLAGCSGRGTFLAGGSTVGQLKTSVSHLEYENAQLKRDVAKLQQENRTIEDRLVQEQLDNGDLHARLDNARNRLRDQGLDPEDQSLLTRGGAGDGSARARALPAGRASTKRRKPPVARIPGQIEPAPPGQTSPSESEPDVPETEMDRSSLRLDDELDHHTFYAGPMRWSPIANKAGDAASPVR